MPSQEQVYYVLLGQLLIASVWFTRQVSSRGTIPRKMLTVWYWLPRSLIAITAPLVAATFQINDARVLFMFGFCYVTSTRLLEREIHKMAERMKHVLTRFGTPSIESDAPVNVLSVDDKAA